MARRKIIIIGGGASGMIAGIIAARQGARVTILERKDRIGKKLLATGNGRCNISNEQMSEARYHSDSFNIFTGVYNQFNLEATKLFFKQLGVEILELENGKLYPFSLQASSVLNVLRYELDRLGIAVMCDEEVIGINLSNKVVVTTSKNKYYGDKLIMATGGKSAPELGSNGSGFKLGRAIGLKVVEPYPSLIQLESNYKYLRHLKGTKVMSNVKIVVEEAVLSDVYGEVLFTDYGLSGLPILDVSRYASKALKDHKASIKVQLDLVPDLDRSTLDTLLINRIEHMPYKALADFFVGLVPKSLIIPLIKDNGLSQDMKASNITKQDRANILIWLKQLSIDITGTRKWNQSQATAGGIDCNEVNPITLSLKSQLTVYLCGEILDIDGDCGGFNLQWAWSSGYVAGKNASEE